jgi:hypothetical protein
MKTKIKTKQELDEQIKRADNLLLRLIEQIKKYKK